MFCHDIFRDDVSMARIDWNQSWSEFLNLGEDDLNSLIHFDHRETITREGSWLSCRRWKLFTALKITTTSTLCHDPNDGTQLLSGLSGCLLLMVMARKQIALN
jgi:hypothetical protein